MPKYRVEVTFSKQAFEVDTDDYKEELEGIDVNDPESISEWAKELIEDDPHGYFDISFEPDEVKVAKKP